MFRIQSTRRAVCAALFFFAGAAVPALASNDIEIVLNAEPRSLEPCQSTTGDVARVLVQNITESLTEVNPDNGEVLPRLATSWEQVDDKTWRMKLREGVKFQNGAPFSAKDVVYTLARMYVEPLQCYATQKMFGNLKIAAKEIDAHTVDISADQPVPIMPRMMSVVHVVPDGTQEESQSRAPIGTGAFKLLEWKPGESIVLVRNDNYWGAKPEAEKVTYVWRTESALRAAMVKTGEADIAQSISMQDADNPDLDFTYFNSETTRVRIDLMTPPLSDVRVRRALNYAIDTEALKTLLGQDTKQATQIVGPTIGGYNPDIKPYEYDPDKARNLLEEARKDGVPVDEKITLIARDPYYSNAMDVAQAMLAMWQAVGFNMDMRVVDNITFYAIQQKPFQEGRKYLLQNQHDNSFGDASFSAYFAYSPDSAASTVTDRALGELIDKAGTLQGEERTKAYQEVFRRVHDDIVADVFMLHMVGYSRIAKRIDFRPNLSTNNMIEVGKIHFVK